MTPEEATKSIGLRFTLRGNNCELTIHDTEILIIVRQVRTQALEEAAMVVKNLAPKSSPLISWAKANAAILALKDKQ